jgi:hypothetical protein
MKKIITLLFAATAFVSVQAQTSREEARKVVLGGQKGSTTTTKTPDSRTENPRDVVLGGSNSESSSRQAQIDQVNREYDAKISSIRNNPTLTQEEKDQAIARLERDRARKIRAINNQDDNYNDDKNSGKKNKKAKGNNGKHLGWEKGVGNPHKNGGSPKGKKKG